jgi:hypothetical protein
MPALSLASSNRIVDAELPDFAVCPDCDVCPCAIGCVDLAINPTEINRAIKNET